MFIKNLASMVLAGMVSLSSLSQAEPSPAGRCKFSNLEQVARHANDHLKYPSDGKDIKLACKKEWPDEFSADEWACFDASIQDGVVYKTPSDVLKAIGVTPKDQP